MRWWEKSGGNQPQGRLGRYSKKFENTYIYVYRPELFIKPLIYVYIYIRIYLSNYIKTKIYTAVSHMKCKISCAPQ